MKLNIYSKENSLRLTIEADSNNVASCGIQEDSILSLSFSTFECVPLEVYDYIDFEGDRYWVLERYIPQMNSRRSWSYSVQLHGVPGLASQTLMVNTADADNPIFNLTAPAREHAALIIANLNRVMNTTEWKVGEVIVSEYIDIEYTGKYASDALSELSSAAGTEWWFDGMTLNISRCEFGEAIPLAYGNGLIGGITPSMAEGVKFFTRLFPVGSSRNIDPDHYGYARLQLPDRAKYVEQDTHLGVVEHFEQEAFEGIFPRRIGTVGTVRTIEKKGEDGKLFTIYYFTDPEIPFDPNDYEIGGLVKRITFQSGELRGREFEVNYESSKKEFEIITQWPYDDDTQLPSKPLVPAPGDEYILWNIRMPEGYYTEAEQEFRQAVDDFMKESRKNISVFQTSTDFTVIEKRGLVLKPGQRIRLESQQMFPDTGYRETRIVSISRSISRPATMDLKLSDVLSTGRISRIEQSIEQIDRYTKQVAAEFPDIIRSWEETPPSDTTLYSSRKSEREFLNKRVGGTVEGVARFLKQLLLDEGFRTANFASGITGVGAQIDSVGAAEMESLTLRRFLEVPQLNYNRVDIAVGDEWSAPGGGVIERVDTQQQIITLRLEEGEIGSARAGDICMGIFHSSNPEQNATEDADDSRGNRRFAGFATVYFQVAEVSGEQNQTLHYERRPVSQNYAQALDPFEAMTFVCYGSFTDPARRTSRYSTRTYQRYMKGVADWEFTVGNIAAQFGDLSNLAVHGLSMSGYSAYLDNIYMQGILRNLEGNFIIDSKTQSLLMASPRSGMGLAFNPDQGLKIGAVYDPETGRFEREYDLALIEQKAENANQKIDELEVSSINLIDGSESITVSAGTNNYYFKRFPIGVVNSGERYALSVQTITNIEGEPVEYSVAIYDTSITTKLSYGAITLSLDKKSVVFSLNKDIVNTDAVLLLYPGIGGSTAGNTVRFDKVMFVRGDKPALSWQPSYNDQRSMADNIAQEKVDGVQIGGVNLIDGTKDFEGFTKGNWQRTDETINGAVVYKITGKGTGMYKATSVVAGKKYTFSCWYKSVGDDTLTARWFSTGPSTGAGEIAPASGTIPVTPEWTRFSVTIDAVKSGYVYLRVENAVAATNTLYVAGYQLEEGTKVSAWKESPADVQASIDAAKQAGEEAKAQLDRWSSDSYISPTEKTGLKQQQADIRGEYNEIIAQAGKYSVSTTAYTTAYNKADTALTKYTASSPVEIAVGTDYADIAAYYTARQNILDAVAEAVKKYSEDLVDNIQIGGVNLLNGTQKFIGENWSVSRYADLTENGYKDFSVAHRDSTSETTLALLASYSNIQFDHGQTYTLSFFAKGTGGIYVSSSYLAEQSTMVENGIPSTFGLSAEWTRFNVTFTATTDTSMSTMRIAFQTVPESDVYLCAVKLEEGNKATSWSESQQDTRSDTEYLRELFKDGSTEIEGGAVMTNAVAVKGVNSEDIVAMLNGSGNFSDTAHKIAMLVLGITGGLDNWKNAPTILYGDGFIKARLGEIGILSVNGNTVEVTGADDNRVIIRTRNISSVADAIGSSGTIPSVSTAAVSVMASTASPFVLDTSESARFNLAVDTMMSCSITSSVNASGTGSANLFIDAVPTDGSDSIRIYSRGASTSTESGSKTETIQKMLAKGSYKIVVTVSASRSPIPEQAGGGSASANMIEYSFTASTRRNLIAPNGMAVVQSANQYAVFTGSIFEVRLGNGGFRITSTGQWQKYNSSTGKWTNVNI